VTRAPTGAATGDATGDATSIDRPVGIGVIGARSMIATKAVLPAIDAAAGARVAAVAARGGAVPARWADVDVGDYDDVLDHPDVEAVYVPLPNSMHREWVERSAAAGRHVLCEKPLAGSAAEAAAMAATCRHHGVLLAEAWMTPFDPRWAAAMRMAAAGAIGPVRTIDARFTFTIPAEAADNYRWAPELGGGALLDVGIYCLGPAAEMWGTEPTTVEATVTSTATGVDATTVAELRWDDGRTARARCSFVEPEVQRLELVGATGRLVLDGDAHTGGTAARRIQVRHGADTEDVEAADGADEVEAADGAEGVEQVEHVDVTPEDPYRRMVEAFAAAVRGRQDWPRPVDRAVDLQRLLDRVRSAAVEVVAP
jgi:predicted dehydrogenase